MKCERCKGTRTRCGGAGQCDHDGSECFDMTIDGIEQNCGEYEAIKCPDCNGTGTKPEPEFDKGHDLPLSGMINKPEPEQDERIREAFEDRIPEHIRKHLHFTEVGDKYVIVKNGENLSPSWKLSAEYYTERFKGYKSGYTSRNAEVEALKADNLELMHEIEALNGAEYRDQHIKRLKAEIESMRCCGNCAHNCKTASGNPCDEGNWTRKTK